MIAKSLLTHRIGSTLDISVQNSTTWKEHGYNMVYNSSKAAPIGVELSSSIFQQGYIWHTFQGIKKLVYNLPYNSWNKF